MVIPEKGFFLFPSCELRHSNVLLINVNLTNRKIPIYMGEHEYRDDLLDDEENDSDRY